MSLPCSLAVAMLDGEAGTAKAGNLTSYLDLETTDGRTFTERLET